MNEEYDENKEEHEVDPFSRLMFGGPRHREEKQEATERKEQDWLFGPKPSHQKDEIPSFLKGPLGEYLQKVDYVEIMHHFDTLMNSANELKPLLKKVKPVLESFLNKK